MKKKLFTKNFTNLPHIIRYSTENKTIYFLQTLNTDFSTIIYLLMDFYLVFGTYPRSYSGCIHGCLKNLYLHDKIIFSHELLLCIHLRSAPLHPIHTHTWIFTEKYFQFSFKNLKASSRFILYTRIKFQHTLSWTFLVHTFVRTHKRILIELHTYLHNVMYKVAVIIP